MKTIFSIVSILTFLNVNAQNIPEIYKDSRDGKEYRLIKIGVQTWFAQNMAFKASEGCSVYENIPENADKYGYLYTWSTAVKVCPAGWHLPNDEEWKMLEIYLGMNIDDQESIRKRAENIGTQLKSETGWAEGGNGNNTSGFNAVPGGAALFYDNSFQFLGEYGYFWTSSAAFNDAWARVLKYDGTYVDRSLFSKTNSLSVRCLKD